MNNPNKYTGTLGGGALTQETINLILKLIPPIDGAKKRTILELGSGYGTYVLSQYYQIFSIEHDSNWIGKYGDCATYFQCGLTESVPDNYSSWYQIDGILHKLPKKYDLLLVDGPPDDARRTNFIHHLHKFNKDAIWVFDDLQRPNDLNTYRKICQMRNVKEDIKECGKKIAGIIPSNK